MHKKTPILKSDADKYWLHQIFLNASTQNCIEYSMLGSKDSKTLILSLFATSYVTEMSNLCGKSDEFGNLPKPVASSVYL